MEIKNEKKLILVLEGPSGAGKDTVMAQLVARYPNTFAHVISTTTRQMRYYESQGNPYYFVNDKEFDNLVESGVIFEQTERHGTKRGMTKTAFDEILNQNKIPVKDCDAAGLEALRKIYGNKVFGVFLTAPVEVIRQRLVKRGDSPEEVEKRVNNFKDHMKQEKEYNVSIPNIDLNRTIREVFEKVMEYYETL